MKNKKFMTGVSIGLIVVLGASMGIGALIGSQTKKPLDFITFDLNDKQYKFSYEDIYTDNEMAAKQLENKFLETALIGAEDPVFKNSQAILDDGGDWNIPYMISHEEVSKADVLNYFIATKLLKDTLTDSVFEYLVNQYSTSKDIDLLPIILEFKGKTNLLPMNFLELLNDSDGKKIIEDSIKTLGKEDSYKNDVLRDAIVYSYLWQDSNSTSYDYFLTKEIAYSKPSMVSSVEFDATKARLGDSRKWYNELTNYTSDESETKLKSSSDWNSFWTGKEEFLVDPSTLDTKIDNGFASFKGVQFGQGAGSTVSSDWTDISQTWNYEDEEQGESITTSGEFTHDNILETGNVYLATPGKAPGKGAVISEDSSSHGKWINGNAQVFVYSQMYPYVFAEKIDDNTFGPSSYSLFANKDGESYTAATSEDEGVTYIFNEWFGEGNASKIGEIYLAESLSSHNDSLSQKAAQYWHDKGYYIELSGKYSDDFSSFIPEDLLK